MCKAVMQNFITEYEPKEDYIAVRMTNDCMKSSGIFTGSVMRTIPHTKRPPSRKTIT